MNPQTSNLHDIYGPVAATGGNQAAVYAIVACILLLAGIVLVYFWRKRKPARLPPQLSPGDRALTQIRQARDLLDSGQIDAYLDTISMILREYIEARFRFHLTRQTTSEFHAYLQTDSGMINIPPQYHRGLTECLHLCDLAKFAHLPATYEHVQPIEEALCQFVQNTMETTEEAKA